MSTGQTKIRCPLWENEDSEFPTGKSEFSSLVHASDTLNQLLNNNIIIIIFKEATILIQDDFQEDPPNNNNEN